MKTCTIATVLAAPMLVASAAAQTINKVPFVSIAASLGDTFSYDTGFHREVGMFDVNLETLPYCYAAPEGEPCRTVVSHREVDHSPLVARIASADEHIDIVKAMNAKEGTSLDGWELMSSNFVDNTWRNQPGPAENGQVLFLLYDQVDVETEFVEFGAQLRLSDDAESLLINDPDRFLSLFGDRYASGVTRGGKYYHHYNIVHNPSSYASSEDFDAFIASAGNPFGEDGIAEYNAAVSNHPTAQVTERLTSWLRGSSSSGLVTESERNLAVFLSPDEMMRQHGEWRSGLDDENMGPIDSHLTRLVDVPHFRQILLEHHPDKLALFERPDITPETIGQLAEGRAYAGRASKSAQDALRWGCTDISYGVFYPEMYETRNKLDTLRREADVYLLGVAKLGENGILDLQESGSAVDYFGAGKAFLDEFKDIYDGTLARSPTQCRMVEAVLPTASPTFSQTPEDPQVDPEDPQVDPEDPQADPEEDGGLDTPIIAIAAVCGVVGAAGMVALGAFVVKRNRAKDEATTGYARHDGEGDGKVEALV